MSLSRRLFFCSLFFSGVIIAYTQTDARLALPVVRINNDQTRIQISEWLAVGPFDEQVDILGYDYLATTGINERDFKSAEEIGRWISKLGPPPNGEPRIAVRRLQSDGYLDIMQKTNMVFDRTEPAKVIYLAVDITAATERRMWLVFGNDDRSMVFLNGKCIATTPLMQEVYTEYVPIAVDLKRGSNVLLIKAPNDNTDWIVHATLYRDREAAEKSTLDHNRVLLKTVVSANRTFGILPETLLKNHAWKVNVRLVDNPSVLVPFYYEKGEITISSAFKGGLCTLTASNGENEFAEEFFVGDVQLAANEITKPKSREALATGRGGDLEALRQRLNVLFRENNYKPLDRWWGRKIVHLLDEYRKLRKDGVVGGMAIRGFWSQIDGIHQSYRIYSPSGASPNVPLPVVVILPTPASANRPFVESAFMASHQEAMEIGRIADTANAIVLWPGYRNGPNSYPSDFAHFLEVVEDAKTIYSIDDSRITLIGSCGAGTSAASYALRWPNAFAAVGFITPIFQRSGGNKDDPPLLIGRDEYASYIREVDPELRFAKEYLRPVRIVYDGAEKDHGDVELSEKFVRLRTDAKKPVLFTDDAKTLCYRMRAFNDVISWLVRQSTPPGEQPSFKKREPDPPSLAGVVAEPFLLVVPTGGSEQEASAARALVAHFQEEWQNVHFGRCKEILDVDATTQVSETHNLLIFGNEKINAVWAQFAEKGSTRTFADRILVNDREFRGRSLSFMSCSPHPTIPGRQVAFIGAQDLRAPAFLTMRLSTCGWFSSIVTAAEGGETKLVSIRR